METYEDLGQVLGTVAVDSETLVERAVVEGRRHQRRRRLGAAGIGVVAIGAVVVGTNLASSGGPDADGTAVAGPTSPSSGHALRHHPNRGESSPGLPSAELTDTRLAVRLPVPGSPVSAKTFGSTTLLVVRTLDPDGSGSGSVRLSLLTSEPMSETQISDWTGKCDKVAALNGPEKCQQITGGWLFTVTARPDIENASPKALDWSATANFKDGTSVQLHATNYVDQADPTRHEPVLDLGQIKQLVTDDVWFKPAS
jgi:hypothetical protein